MSSGQSVSVRVERIAAREEETVEGTRKGWRESRQRRRSWGASGAGGAREGGSGRRWNTNMRIKAVEGIKAYNRGAGSLRRAASVSARLHIYLSISLYFGLFVRAYVNGSRPLCGHRTAASVVLFGYRYPRSFLNEIFF